MRANKVLWIMLLAACFAVQTVQAQQTAAPKQRQVEKTADRRYWRLAYAMAIKKYERAIAKEPTYNAMSKLADSYRRLHMYDKAASYYDKLGRSFTPSSEDYLRHAEVMMHLQRYPSASPLLEKYLAKNPTDRRAQNMMLACANPAVYRQDSARFWIQITQLNTPESDFSPAFVSDQLLFVSGRRTSGMEYAWTKRFFLDVFATDVNLYGPHGDITRVKGTLNTMYHEGPVQELSQDVRMVFTRNVYNKGKLSKDSVGTVNLQLLFAEKSGDRWNVAESFPYNSKYYSVGHPAISPDRKRLYFASDMPGGHGGVDLWYSDLQADGSWAKPVNLGREINTEGNEMFPHVDNHGRLFFASTGHPGLGGLDIFHCEAKPGTTHGFDEPKNLGYPINTSYDDFGLVIHRTGALGFFSSNRPGGAGDDDIYMFKVRNVLRGEVYDLVTNELIPASLVGVLDPGIENFGTATDAYGAFSHVLKPNPERTRLQFNASHESYKANKLELEVPKPRSPFEEVFVRIPLTRGAGMLCPDDALVMKGTARQDDRTTVIPGAKVRVISYDTLLTADANGNFSLPVQPNQRYRVYIENNTPAAELVTTPANCDPETIPVDVFATPLSVSEKPFFIIYYNFDKHNIRRDASLELDTVFRYMSANPRIIVELSSHTDIRGTDQYNETLSENRAREAFEYLTARGIVANRLHRKWFGEKVPAVPCATDAACTEFQHQLNRRTEFKVVGMLP